MPVECPALPACLGVQSGREKRPVTRLRDLKGPRRLDECARRLAGQEQLGVMCFGDGRVDRLQKVGIRPIRHRCGKDKTSGVDADDLIRLFLLDRCDEFIDHETEKFPAAEDRRDVLKDDSGFRKVMHFADRGI